MGWKAQIVSTVGGPVRGGPAEDEEIVYIDDYIDFPSDIVDDKGSRSARTCFQVVICILAFVVNIPSSQSGLSSIYPRFIAEEH